MAISRLLTNFRRSILLSDVHRNISLSAARNLKEISEVKIDDKTTIVEGVLIPDPKEHLLLKPSKNGACCLCSAGVDVKHTDVLILQQFLKRDGRMLPRRITNLCKIQQKRVGIMVAMAQKAGLMPNLTPANSKKDPKKRSDWRKYNTYFDEDTIQHRYW